MRRLWAVLLALAALAACGGDGDGAAVGGTAPAGPTTVPAEPTTTDPARPTTTAPAPATVPGRVFAGIWPFTSSAELEAAGSDPAWRDPAATARAFADRYIGITDPAVFDFRSTGAATGEVPVGFRVGEGGQPVANPQPTTVVRLLQGASGAWTVVGAASPDIEVDTPAPLAPVSSPVSVSGRARAYEGTVQVEVREDGMAYGQSLGRGFVTGRGDGVLGPFSGTVSFRSPSKPAGAVVFYERNQATGGSPVLRATVVRVAFAT